MIIVPNFLDIRTCMDVCQSIEDDIWDKRCWTINKGNWQSNLTESYDGAVYITDFKEHFNDLDRKVCWDLTAGNFLGHEIDWSRSAFIIQAWDYGSGCNWHADNHCDFAATIYLNSHWEEEWGGNLEYYDQYDQVQTLVPAPGTLVLNHKQQLHRVTKRVRRLPALRFSLQLFGKYKDETIQEEATET